MTSKVVPENQKWPENVFEKSRAAQPWKPPSNPTRTMRNRQKELYGPLDPCDHDRVIPAAPFRPPHPLRHRNPENGSRKSCGAETDSSQQKSHQLRLFSEKCIVTVGTDHFPVLGVYPRTLNLRGKIADRVRWK